MFWRKISWASVFRQLGITLRRFPLSLLMAVAGTFAAMLLTEAPSVHIKHIALRVLLTAGIGVGLLVSSELAFARYKPTILLRVSVYVVALALLALYYFLLPPQPGQLQALQAILLFIGFILSATFIAYINWLKNNGFWQFNRIMLTRCVIGAIFSIVLFAGLAIALLAVSELFEFRIDPENYMRLWLCVTGIFFPIFVLSGVPKNLKKLQLVQQYPKVLRIFSLFLLLPLVAIYFFILYAYTFRIIWQWEWPEGWVANLVLGFSLAGIAAFLFTYPLRKTNKWIKAFGRWFFVLMLPMVLLLLLAIWRRVSEYGITENRYLVLLLGMWLLVVAFYFMVSRKRNIKFIPVTLSLLALLAAFGPWGAFAVSENSQLNRLKTILNDAGLLHQGLWKKASNPIPDEHQYQISGILNYFEQNENLEALRPLLGNQLTPALQDSLGVPRFNAVATIMKSRNLKYQPYPAPEKENYFSFIAKPDLLLETSDYDYVIEYEQAVQGKVTAFEKEILLDGQVLRIRYLPEATQLRLTFMDDTLATNLQGLLATHSREVGEAPESHEIAQELTGEKMRVKIIWKNIQGRKENNKYKPEYLQARILLRISTKDLLTENG